ncbi:hypothetical protein ACMHYB_60345 [Sorangium sp. So ce1128]
MATRGLTSRDAVLKWIANPANEKSVGIVLGEWNRDNSDQTIQHESQEEKETKRKREDNPGQPTQTANPASTTGERKTKRQRREERPAKAKEWKIASVDWDHILLHTRDNNDKSVHGIYLSKNKRGISPLIQEAVGVITELLDGKRPPRVLAAEKRRYNKSRAFVIDMERKIGTMGGHTKNGEDARYLRVELEIPVRSRRLTVENAFPADTTDLKH